MNKMKRLTGRKILLVAVAFCAFGFAKAQDTQTEKNTLTLTLDKALEIALDENPTMKVAAEEIDEAVGLEHEVARKECKVFKDELYADSFHELLLSISVIV